MWSDDKRADFDGNQLPIDRLFEAGDLLKAEKGVADNANGYYVAGMALKKEPWLVNTLDLAIRIKGIGKVLAEYIMESLSGDVPVKLRELRRRADPGADGSPGRGT